MIREYYDYPPEWTNFTGECECNMPQNGHLVDIIKAIRNRCNTILVLTKMENVSEQVLNIDILPCLHTLLEDLHEDSQKLIDDHCIE